MGKDRLDTTQSLVFVLPCTDQGIKAAPGSISKAHTRFRGLGEVGLITTEVDRRVEVRRIAHQEETFHLIPQCTVVLKAVARITDTEEGIGLADVAGGTIHKDHQIRIWIAIQEGAMTLISITVHI